VNPLWLNKTLHRASRKQEDWSQFTDWEEDEDALAPAPVPTPQPAQEDEIEDGGLLLW
jgi:hypothetical protein